MANKNTAAGAAAATVVVPPVEMTRVSSEEALGKLAVTEAKTSTEVNEETKPEAAVEAEAKPEAETSEPEIPDGYVKTEVLEKRIGEITGKSKQAVEEAQAAASAAKAEAEALRAKADEANVAALAKIGAIPELLEPAQAEVLKKYDTVMQSNAVWKQTLRNANRMVREGRGEEVVEGKTAAQWAETAEAKLDEIEPTIRELAPEAAVIKRTHDARKAEIFKLGLKAVREREAAAQTVAQVAAGKPKEPTAQVTVKPATGAKSATAAGSKRGPSVDKFREEAKANAKDAAANFLAQMTG